MSNSSVIQVFAVTALVACVASASHAADYPSPQFGPSQWVSNEGKLSCEATCSKLNASPIFTLWDGNRKLNVCAVNTPDSCQTGAPLTGHRSGLSLQGNNWCRIAWPDKKCPLYYDFECLCSFGKPK